MAARKTALLWDRLAAADPGLMRLASATRAVLGAVVSLGALTAMGRSGTELLVGGFTAMVTSLAISDLHPRNQLITLGLGAPVFLAALTAGTVLTPYPVAAGSVFLLLIFLAVHARRYGARGQGVGVFGFMAFFLSQFTAARVDQLPQMGAAALVAFGAVVGVCYGPGFMRAPRVLGRLRRTFDARLHDVLRHTAALLGTGQDAEAVALPLERRLDRLHETVLLIEDFLGERAVDETADVLLLRHISRAEVATQRFTVLAVRAVATSADDPAALDARQRLAAHIRLLGHRLARRTLTAWEDDPADRPDTPAPLRDCFQGLAELAAAVRLLGPHTDSASAAVRTPREPATPRTTASRGGRHRGAGSGNLLGRADREDRGRGTTRHAVQVTAASAPALLGGHVLSPDHWYWAVVATWVVSIDTASTGEVLLQSVRRLTGTVLGAVFGYGLAALAGPDEPLLLGMLLACVFGIFTIPSRAYWAVTFFITGALGMLLALLDTFSADVLVVRVQETALGVSCGVLATVVVLPMTVRRATDEELAHFLLVLGRLVRVTARGPGAGSTPDPIRTAHDLDRALASFRKACLPLTHPLNPWRGRRDRARHLLGLLEAGAYHARSAAVVAGLSPRGEDTARGTRLTAAADRVEEQVTHLFRLASRRRGTASPSARPEVAGALSLLSGERRACHSPQSPRQRLLLHIDRLGLTLSALIEAMAPPTPADEDGAAPAPGCAGSSLPGPGRAAAC